jgi:hypothetical protein
LSISTCSIRITSSADITPDKVREISENVNRRALTPSRGSQGIKKQQKL